MGDDEDARGKGGLTVRDLAYASPAWRHGRASRAVIYAVLVVFTLAALTPFTWTLLNSVKTNNEIMSKPFSMPEKFLWGNYREAWTTGKLDVYFWNSVVSTIPVVVVSIAISALAGYAVARITFWGRSFLLFLFLFGLTVPFQAKVIHLYYVLMGLHLLDNLWGVILPSIGGPFGIFLMRAFFLQLPNELVDSAKIDGCSELGVFWRVMFPLAQPAIVSLVVFSFMAIWNEYFLALIVLTSDVRRTLPLGVVHFQSRYYTDYRLVFAALVVSIIPVVVVYLAFQRQFIRGVAVGSYR
jgi:raffinose/stachyose/melibiose transport system permease protein